ncbi:capsular polysaccharide synthesis protein [Flavobacterium sp. YJ01]|uniref:glycosyltransferase family 32 protein n=1 Tax=Flavobacterium sp. YJ01 TaxID=3031997 RepID=UPI0023E39237|nr:glycosyltransferase [Flavobacterium sp. YJ01]WET03911.1 capsular polysaccharide synthesis protein [Flavobacterium sp. YJ01]
MNISKEEKNQNQSLFVRDIVQKTPSNKKESLSNSDKIPKKIIQFWDNHEQLPSDVKDCIQSWSQLDVLGYERLLFNNKNAGEFILEKLGDRYKNAYDKCYHPAMQSDYFRLCYIFIEGGCYVDADDVYSGVDIDPLFDDDRLKIQPLCYDTTTYSMVSQSIFTMVGEYSNSWIFYFNNNPLIAKSRNPIIEQALSLATSLLEEDTSQGLPEIQSTTGPGNLTKSVTAFLKEKDAIVDELILVLKDWDNTAESKWPLSYRNDARNWRLSNSVNFNG